MLIIIRPPQSIIDSPIDLLICVWADTVKEQQHLMYISAEMNSLNLSYQFLNLPLCSMISDGRKFRISTPPSSLKTVAMIFTDVGITLNIFFLGNMALLH